MIYAIYPCPVSFCPPRFILPPYHFAPYHFAPWKSFNVHYFPIPVSFCPYNFAPISFCPPIILPLYHFAPPLEIVSWFILFTHVQYHFAPLDSFCPHIILPPIILPPWKWFNDLHYLPMSRIILPPALDFVFILIKSPLQQKLMTGAHPVTVAPLVSIIATVKASRLLTLLSYERVSLFTWLY